MTKQIRNLGVFLTLCYMALFVQVNRLTVFQAEELQDKPENNRQAIRDFDAPRGTISTADGVVLARSVPSTNPDDRFELQREYPTGALFGHITGFFNPLSIGSDGVERQYNDELAGRTVTDITDLDSLDRFFEDFFVDSEHVGNVTLTLRNDVQSVAAQALAGRRGSVVALDPRTGAILAMYSNPSYDPTALAVHNAQEATAASEALNADATKPRLARAYQEIFAPGSTFKVVTASAGVESNLVTPEEPVYEVRSTYTAPTGGSPIPNFGGGSCGGALFEILQRSCNTAFAQMGVDIGADNLTRTSEAFGFNQDVPIDLPRAATSVFPVDNAQDAGFRAQIAIGQNNDAATPLQMAMVAGAIANGGEVMTPHVMAEIRDEDEEVIETYEEEAWTRAVTPGTAGVIREAMISVVSDGTATRLDPGIDGIEVGGKTGTAQLGETGRAHAWIIGFAGPENGDPEVAIAVIVEADPNVVSEQTGGQVAAPIGAEVLRAALASPPTAEEGQ